MDECLYNFKQDLKENLKMTTYLKSKYRIFYTFLFNSILPIDLCLESEKYISYINNKISKLSDLNISLNIMATEFSEKYYSDKNVCNDIDISKWNIYIYVNILNENILLDEFQDLHEKSKIMIFIYNISFDALYNTIINLKNKKIEYEIHVYELTVNPLSVFTQVYYGNSLETSFYKIKFILKNQNLIIQNKNLQEINNLLKESELLCMHLFINSKISNLFNFYHLNEFNCAYEEILNDIFYGIVPVQAIKKKYKKFFTIHNKQMANYNYDYKCKSLYDII